MLTQSVLENILAGIPRQTIGVVGDLFLDRYLDIDAALTEPSIETGLDAYQVTGVRSSPGAAGTIINNLAALGVGRIIPVAVIGDDGEGYELLQALDRLPAVDKSFLLQDRRLRTPTYTKPMLHQSGQPARELNRLDIKNRSPLPTDVEEWLMQVVDTVFPLVDALLVLDQVSEPDCGVITERMRQRLSKLGEAQPDKLILADSRERIHLFHSVCIKPNRQECLGAVSSTNTLNQDAQTGAIELSRRTGRAVFCTMGDAGILVVKHDATGEQLVIVPAYPVTGPIDIVGAGDSCSAAIATAVASGATLEQAAAFGNLVASITIQQIGTTGTASPEQIRKRFSKTETS